MTGSAESEATLSEHLPDSGQFVLEPRDRFGTHCCQAPAVMQFQRVTVAHRHTGGVLQSQRLCPPLRIDLRPVGRLLRQIGPVRFLPCRDVFGDELTTGCAAPRCFSGGTGPFDSDNHRHTLPIQGPYDPNRRRSLVVSHATAPYNGHFRDADP